MALAKIELGPIYMPNPSIGRPISGAQIFIGTIDLDPEIVGNQKQVSVQEEDGTITAVSQPILTGQGGVPLYQGSPVIIVVDGDYSMKVLDSGGSQIYYVPKALDGATLLAIDLASTDNAKGASLVGIEDSGGSYAATDVEAALAEIASDKALKAKGVLVTGNPQTVAAASSALVSFAASTTVIRDSDSFYSGGAPTRLTIPAGVSQIIVKGGVGYDTGPHYIQLYKNGAKSLGNTEFDIIARNEAVLPGANLTWISLTTPILDVSPGDYFELFLTNLHATVSAAGTTGHFAIEVIG